MAGRSCYCIHRPAHQGAESFLRGAESLVRKKRPAPEEIFQYQRSGLQEPGTERQTAHHDRGRAASSAGN